MGQENLSVDGSSHALCCFHLCAVTCLNGLKHSLKAWIRFHNERAHDI
jgi:hypothetical protein